MMRSRNINNGYITLLMLFIVVAIIVLLIVRTDLFSTKEGQKSMLEQNVDAVQQAKDVKALIEKNNSEYPSQ